MPASPNKKHEDNKLWSIVITIILFAIIFFAGLLIALNRQEISDATMVLNEI